ncbi:MAG: PAS domain S-box protein, partial [Chitinophagaceae bacterium]
TRLALEPYLELPRYRFRNAAGEWRWIETNAMNMLKHPEVHGIIVNSRDVTEKKLAEDELNKLSLVAKETLNAVIITDEDQHIIWVNNAFTNITGYLFNEVVGRRPGELLQGVDTNPETIAYMRDRTVKQVPYECELINYTKSGKKFWTRLQVQPLFDDSGKINRYFGINTDITERVELESRLEEEQLLKQQHITEAVIHAEEKERSEIGKELHDNVNQILGATKLYIDLASKDTQNQKLYLTRSAEYVLNAIDEIRKLSKALVTPVIHDLGLKEAIMGIVEDLEILQPIEIILDADEFYEEDINDKFKLNAFRIVQEQLNNIIKHSQATSVRIRLIRNDDFIDLLIIDNGVGFDINKRRNGVGITNIISRTELYKGRIEIQSEVGKGVLLEIRFPLTEAVITV